LLKLAKILIHYGKGGKLKYLSHLELARAFERSFRRAYIEVQMSSGFNPRPKISYGPALPVGIGSSAEYMLVDLREPVSEKLLIEKLSSALPKGLSVCKAKYIQSGQSSIMSIVKSVAYRVRANIAPPDTDMESVIKQLMSEERLLVQHKNKEKWVETGKAILDWKLEGTSDSEYEFYLLMSVGDESSTRPEAVLSKLSEKSSQPGGVEILDIERIGQYTNRENPLLNIYQFYESVTMGSEQN